MTQTPIPKLICQLAVPTIISMLVTSFYNMADTFFVGKINTSATAAVGVVFPLMAIIQAFGFFCGHGSGNYISRQLGAQNFEDASRMSATGFVTAFVLGLCILGVGFAFTDPLLYIMGSTETILPYARDYMRIILLGAPYMTASLVLNNQLRFQGSAFYSMIGITFGAVLNVGLDPLFIFVFDMGVAGAAWATILSQFVSFCLLIAGTFRGGNLKLNLRNFSPSLKYYKNIVKGGTPSLCPAGTGQLCNHLPKPDGGGPTATRPSRRCRLSPASPSLPTRLSSALDRASSRCGGFNYGAKLYARVAGGLLVLRQACHLHPAGGGGAGLAAVREPDCNLSAQRPAGHRVAARWRCGCSASPSRLVGWITISNMMLQTIGRTVKASLLAMSRQFLFFVPAVLLLPNFFGMLGVQLSQPIADVFSFLLAVPLALSELRDMNRLEEQLRIAPQADEM